jgi:hypothetical protein
MARTIDRQLMMDHVARNTATEAIRGSRSAMILATEIAWRLTDVLVTKNILSKAEARATLFAIADGIRNDAHGNTTEEATDMLARWIEDRGMRVSPPHPRRESYLWSASPVQCPYSSKSKSPVTCRAFASDTRQTLQRLKLSTWRMDSFLELVKTQTAFVRGTERTDAATKSTSRKARRYFPDALSKVRPSDVACAHIKVRRHTRSPHLRMQGLRTQRKQHRAVQVASP